MFLPRELLNEVLVHLNPEEQETLVSAIGANSDLLCFNRRLRIVLILSKCLKERSKLLMSLLSSNILKLPPRQYDCIDLQSVAMLKRILQCELLLKQVRIASMLRGRSDRKTLVKKRILPEEALKMCGVLVRIAWQLKQSHNSERRCVYEPDYHMDLDPLIDFWSKRVSSARQTDEDSLSSRQQTEKLGFDVSSRIAMFEGRTQLRSK